MKLATAELSKKEAMKELENIYKNWDKMKKDAPIYWEKDNLVGDILKKEIK